METSSELILPIMVLLVVVFRLAVPPYYTLYSFISASESGSDGIALDIHNYTECFIKNGKHFVVGS